MRASAWMGSGGGQFGVYVGTVNRRNYFDPTWKQIEVEIDGRLCPFALTPGFWNHCTEFRDRGEPVIRNWLQRHHTTDWERGSPPEFELLPLGDGKFRLIP